LFTSAPRAQACIYITQAWSRPLRKPHPMVRFLSSQTTYTRRTAGTLSAPDMGVRFGRSPSRASRLADVQRPTNSQSRVPPKIFASPGVTAERGARRGFDDGNARCSPARCTNRTRVAANVHAGETSTGEEGHRYRNFLG
jgi:hypothetical protein